MSPGATPDRRVAGAVVVVGGVVFAVLAFLLVPWSWVPGGHLVKVPASDVFTAAQIRHAEAYSSAQRHLSWAAYGLSCLVAVGLGLSPYGARLVGRPRVWWWVRVVVGSGLLLGLGQLVALPFGWRMHHNAVVAGLSTQGAGGWLRDVGVSFLISWITTALALLVLVALARRSARRWPLWGALLAAGLAVLGSFLWPVVVEPLFNDFRPLPAGTLRSQILHLADVEGVHISDVLVADASRRTTTLNAYVSGFGSTRRVVLYDTLLKTTPRREVLAVVAHELGHAAHRDVLIGTVLGAAGGAAGVGLLGLVLSSERLRRWCHVTGADDPRVVAPVLALVVIGSFLASPVENTISRAIEARADRASLQATHDPAAFIALQRRLAVTSLADPTPPAWSQLWWGTHPTALQRIGIAEAEPPLTSAAVRTTDRGTAQANGAGPRCKDEDPRRRFRFSRRCSASPRRRFRS
ncbi:MAG: M48 family metalloprotease [Marmoricola sp.]